MLREIARGLGAYGDAMPGPSSRGSDSGSWTRLGSISMVPAYGIQRWATYRQVYLTNPWVFAAVNTIANDISRLPLHVYALDEKARKTRIRSDLPNTPGRLTGGQELDRLLSGIGYDGKSPNAMHGATMRDRLTNGNALWEILRDGYGSQPTGLDQIPWSDVVRIEGRRKPLYYEVRDGENPNRVRRLLPGDVVHFGYGTDPQACYGVSPLEAMPNTLALYDAIMRSLRAYFANAMQGNGYISVDDLTRKKATEIRELIADLYSSPENAGKLLVATGKWMPMSSKPDETLLELIRLSREEVVAGYHIPPPVVGILEQAIKSNVKELREQYGRDTLGPWASEFEGDLQAQLLPQQRSWSSLFTEFQLAELLRPDLEARALVYQRMMPYYSIDEIRGFENQTPFDIPGVTDVPWAPSGYLPLTSAGRTQRSAQGAVARELGVWTPPARD